MFLAEKTVKNHVSALFVKLGMERRTQAAAYAVRAFGDHTPAAASGTWGPETEDHVPCSELASSRHPRCYVVPRPGTAAAVPG